MNKKVVKKMMAIGLSAMMAIGMNATVFAADDSSESVKGALEGVKLSFGTTALFAPFTYYDTDGTALFHIRLLFISFFCCFFSFFFCPELLSYRRPFFCIM